MATYVIVPRGWSGAWAWRGVAKRLQAKGHEVFTATLTGCGERSHLANPEINLEVHIQDVVNILTYENLTDVTLVGHSYAGIVITGVSERMPERLSHLIYLDAFVPLDGQSISDIIALN